MWLPTAADWNGRYQAVGNVGWAGGAFSSLSDIASQAPPVDAFTPAMTGFVTSATDGGHGIPGQGSFGMNPDGSFNEASFRDFGERAVHEMARSTKLLIREFYG